ncbi:hypothetical protein GCM10028778_20300 [Barrientosiimonas marina]|uniref:DUF4352 domain-containing protein n=1 Tax=Lentibacillus kimchii TaxID=1542911 RepID=A0ABW2UT56_9BACI
MPYEIIAAVLSIISLIISIIVAMTSLWRSNAKIKIHQLQEDRNWILKSYDGLLASNSSKNKKHEPNMTSITLVEIIITNNSSLPLSVLELRMDGAMYFNSYSYTNPTYKVTPDNGSEILFGSSHDPLHYLQPIFTLEPYTSERGHLHLWMHNKESIQPGIHTLTIITSRGNFKRKINLKNTFESANQKLYT